MAIYNYIALKNNKDIVKGKIDAEDFGLTKENLKEASDTVKGAAIAAGQNLKLGGAALGKALADTRLELDRKNLRPVFLEDLPNTLQILPQVNKFYHYPQLPILY